MSVLCGCSEGYLRHNPPAEGGHLEQVAQDRVSPPGQPVAVFSHPYSTNVYYAVSLYLLVF